MFMGFLIQDARREGRQRDVVTTFLLLVGEYAANRLSLAQNFDDLDLRCDVLIRAEPLVAGTRLVFKAVIVFLEQRIGFLAKSGSNDESIDMLLNQIVIERLVVRNIQNQFVPIHNSSDVRQLQLRSK